MVVVLAIAASLVARDDASPPRSQVASDRPGLQWGAWLGDERTGGLPPWDFAAVRQFERQVGKGMSLLHFGTPMADRHGRRYFPFPAAQFDAIREHGSTPFFSWSTHAMRNYRHRAYTLRAVIAGRHDRHLRSWAEAAKAWGHPFFLRFNWEMNGDWFPWSERYGSNRRGEYVRAWRHVHDIFNEAGVRNATWVWCPAADARGILQPLASLYPGDAYVDWTCLDAYNGNDPWTSFAGLIGSSYERIRRLAPGKPMAIGETSSTETGGSKARWITAMFRSLPARFPQIRALVWFDKSEPGPGDHTDWNLDSSRKATAAFAKGVSASRFESRARR